MLTNVLVWDWGRREFLIEWEGARRVGLAANSDRRDVCASDWLENLFCERPIEAVSVMHTSQGQTPC